MSRTSCDNHSAIYWNVFRAGKKTISRTISIKSRSTWIEYTFVFLSIWIFIAWNRSWRLFLYCICVSFRMNTEYANKRNEKKTSKIDGWNKLIENPESSFVADHSTHISIAISRAFVLFVRSRARTLHIQYCVDSIGHFYFVQLIDSIDAKPNSKSPSIELYKGVVDYLHICAKKHLINIFICVVSHLSSSGGRSGSGHHRFQHAFKYSNDVHRINWQNVDDAEDAIEWPKRQYHK